MSILPILAARAIAQKLVRAGFRYLHTQGNHYHYRHPITNRITSIPVHGNKDIGRGLLTRIIKQAGLTVKESIDL